jgi:hypothetical protein
VKEFFVSNNDYYPQLRIIKINIKLFIVQIVKISHQNAQTKGNNPRPGAHFVPCPSLQGFFPKEMRLLG